MAEEQASTDPGGVLERRFADPDEMAAAVRHADVELLPLARPAAGARLLDLELGGCSLQLGELPVSHLARARVHPGFYRLAIPRQMSAPLLLNGHRADLQTVLLYRPGAELQASAQGSDGWATFSISTERMARALAARSGSEPLSFPESCRVARLDPRTRAGLASILSRVEVAAAGGGALTAEERRGLEEALVAIAVRIAEGLSPRPPERERTLQAHGRIVAQAEEFIRTRLALPLYIADLCQATGVSERTLRSAFRNVYGVGPNRFLKLHRLNQVRRVLSRGGEETLVSEVAARHGFWDLGRFAGDYRGLFGEPPSTTLRGARRAEA